ncbi:hypothetical protein JX265_001024 [Neoarthrinium moseri]|uniref:Uncharacterized protein n=1 Tax=Neoarthrinium moseri TaxID=1658444 RepID=A0A9P9WWW0_9PEZI|nr:hypothetical protein JX265_001024 [Neoarthrinium moseri]
MSTTSATPQPHLEGIPLELLRMICDEAPPEALACLSLVSHFLRHQLGPIDANVSGEVRAEFLKIMERNSPLVYCPWCDKLHMPERSVLAGDKGRRACQSTQSLSLMQADSYVDEMHPVLLYGIAKYHRERRQASHLWLLLPSVGKISHHPASGINTPQTHVSIRVKDNGIFAKHQTVLAAPHLQDNNRLHVHHCTHNRTQIEPERIRCDLPGGISMSRRYNSHTSLGLAHHNDRLHSCEVCNRDIRIEVYNKNPPAVRFTTWSYLGPGESVESIAMRRVNPRFRAVGETTLGAGRVRELFETPA